jgi:hypothetical protein
MILVALGSSVQLLVIGILGAYIGRIYEEVQRRPLYAVAKEVNFSVKAQEKPGVPSEPSDSSGNLRPLAQQPPGLPAGMDRGRGGKAP